jgi:predicted Zn-dependent protease with MMP-like domain
MSNVEIVIEHEPPAGQPLLGLYQGVPLTRRGSSYGAVLPDKITIFHGPLVRLYGHHPETLRREVRRVVLHESPTTTGSATSAWSNLTVTKT